MGSGMSTLGRSKGFSCMRMDSFIMLMDFWGLDHSRIVYLEQHHALLRQRV